MTVTAATTTDAAMVTDVLTEAFTGDPLMAWLFPDPDTHVDCLATWWGFLTENRPDGAELWITSDGGSGALWYAPDFDAGAADESRPATLDESAEEAPDPFIEMVAGLVGDRLPIVVEMFLRLRAAHPEELHWYLPAVGTRPACQGQGSGGALLAPVLARCDQQGLPAYLESSNPRNVPFYLRLGFEVTGEITTPDDAASLTAMWRRPR